MGTVKRILPKFSYMSVAATAASQVLKGQILSEEGEMLVEYSYSLPYTENLANDTVKFSTIADDAITNGPSSTAQKARAYDLVKKDWIIDPASFTYQMSTAGSIVWNCGARYGEPCTTASLPLVDWDYMGDFGA